MYSAKCDKCILQRRTCAGFAIIFGMEGKRKIPYGVMNWNHPISIAVVEVCGSAGYNWFNITE